MGGQESSSIGMEDALEIFYLDNQSRRLTPATQRFYRVSLTIVHTWFIQQGIARLDQVSAHHIRTFLAQRQEAGLATYTQHKYARVLRTFFNFCVREELIAKSPMATVTMPRVEKKLPTSFTEAEAQAILDACTTERDRALVLVLLDTGVRAAEVLALNVGDVDLKHGAVLVRLGKGQKQRTVYLGLKARKQLIKYISQAGISVADSPLFLSGKTGGRLTLGGLAHFMARLRKRTGIPHLSAHTFRRTFALWSLRSGMSIYHLQRLMGHEDIKVLQHYLGLVETDLRKAHEQHGTVDAFLR